MEEGQHKMTAEEKIEKLKSMVPDKCPVCAQTVKTRVLFEDHLRVDCACANFNAVWSLPSEEDLLELRGGKMKKELDEQLCREFPNLYRERNWDGTRTRMCDGFPGDGWYQLIYDLSKKIEDEIMKMPEEERSRFAARQVKEKFGGLRFYMTDSTETMDKNIAEAYRIADVTCEICGRPGELRGRDSGRHWIRTLCEEHKNI